MGKSKKTETDAKTDAKGAFGESRILLFEIDDKKYTMPKGENVGASLTYIRLVNTRGQDAGTFFALSSALGEEGYLALETYPEVTDAMIKKILRLVIFAWAGGPEGPKA